MPRVNLLLADDVGLGKTIEAGLVLQELMLRHRARTALVVCPASLLLKWRDEMQDKFGLSSGSSIRRCRTVCQNAGHSRESVEQRLITSIDWLKRDGPMRSFMEAADHGGLSAQVRRADP